MHFYPRPPRGGRHPLRQTEPLLLRISIHALREEGDNAPFFANSLLELFLSTPSARRATQVVQFFLASVGISIHALREEGDPLLPPHR